MKDKYPCKNCKYTNFCELTGHECRKFKTYTETKNMSSGIMCPSSHKRCSFYDSISEHCSKFNTEIEFIEKGTCSQKQKQITIFKGD